MSLEALRSSPATVQIKADSVKVANAVPVKKEETGNALKSSDTLKTSGTSKSPVWEGIKLGAKDGAKAGLVMGPVATVATVAIAAGVCGAFNGKGFAPLYFGAKPLLAAAGVGLVIGPALGAITGAKEYGKTGIAVDMAVKNAQKTGGDEAKTAEKYGKILGAASGAVRGAYAGYRMSSSLGTQARIGITLGASVIAGTGGYFAGGAMANKVYNAAK